MVWLTHITFLAFLAGLRVDRPLLPLKEPPPIQFVWAAHPAGPKVVSPCLTGAVCPCRRSRGRRGVSLRLAGAVLRLRFSCAHRRYGSLPTGNLHQDRNTKKTKARYTPGRQFNILCFISRHANSIIVVSTCPRYGALLCRVSETAT